MIRKQDLDCTPTMKPAYIIYKRPALWHLWRCWHPNPVSGCVIFALRPVVRQRRLPEEWQEKAFCSVMKSIRNALRSLVVI